MKRIYLLACTIIISTLSLFASASDSNYSFNEKLYNGQSLCEYASVSDIPNIKGHSAYVYNVETGSVIYRKNQDDIVHPASTVKLMTAIIAYENIDDLQTIITASKSAVNSTKGSNMSIKAGEQFTAEQLLNGLLIVGANDAANVLAEHVAGDINSFCQLMNTKAKEIGATKTHFTNPTGLHSPEMVTTAKDIAIIGNYFHSINTLLEMSNTTRFTISPTAYTPQQRTLLNRNFLISRVRSEDYFYPGAVGMSLGSTEEAGDCVVTSISDASGMTYICVVMSAHTTDEINHACNDAKALMDLVKTKFKYSGVLTKKTIISEIPVELAVDTDHITLLPDSDVSALLPVDFSYENDISIEPRVGFDAATAPIAEGDYYGEAVVKYKNDIILGSVKLVASTNVEKSNVLYLLDCADKFITGRWFKLFIISASVLLLFYFIASAAFASHSRRYRSKRR